MYKLKYLPLALKDLREITDYISETLINPKAAMDLVDVLDKSISRLQQFPYSCKVYQPIQSLEAEYRMLPVKNYLVFYLVTENEVVIHRIIYAKVNLEKIIK
ncbi:MAG: type II toxin-antitoxin system RelE/ParE family toxin [Clostridia bacterium]|nr:type II toxin-antitoxin system RelE/ParE family toxin [Clostridia bacterium]